MSHLGAALERLDLLLHRQILRLRASYELSLDEFRGLYISDELVDRILKQSQVEQQPDHDLTALTRRAEAMRHEHAERMSDVLPWKHLVTTFELKPFEQDVLLLALAPEIDLKYETIYAYLNNDVSRRWPTFDLALRLFAESRVESRHLLQKEETLLSSGLLRTLKPTREHASWLATGFVAAPSVVRFLLRLDVWGAPPAPLVLHEQPAATWTDLPQSDELVAALERVVDHFRQPDLAPPVLVFEGRRGAGRAKAAEAVCRVLERRLLHLDVDALRATADLPEIMQTIHLQQRLEPAGFYVERMEALFDGEGRPVPEARRVVEHLTRLQGPVVFACTPGTPWHALLGHVRCLVFQFEEPGYEQRRHLWRRHLAASCTTAPDALLDAVAERFVLNSGQIGRAVTAARDAQHGHGTRAFSPEVLFDAARAESGQRLSRLASKVRLCHTWEDLVLPAKTLRRIQEVAAAIRHRDVVYERWNFERRIAAGKGLKVLFTGTPGTGKTMTASVIARDLGLDLYKIDLSGVVSKYIGETEKNLDRIFQAAHASNAILFFDEADALFGKRSEVKDAHDRYANIETSYLLQKMEEHEGAVILATNLRKNIDEAFSRRMHYVVEFPMPDVPCREQLWRGMFPAEAPMADDVNFYFLARQFMLSGGDIQNVALDAAFLAAQDGQVIGMKQLVNAVARQLTKQGRLPSTTDFRQYHGLLSDIS